MAETPDSIMCYLLRSIAEKLVQFKSPATTMSQTNSNPSNEMTTNIVINSQPTDEKMLGNDVEQENIPPPPPPEPPSSSQMKSDPELAASIVAVNVPTYLLSRFLALIGHITLKQLIFLESAVLTELKRRASIKEDRNSKHKSKSSRKITRTSRVSMTEQSGNASATSGQSTVDEDCGLVGVAADDAEAEYIREICDEELLKSADLILHHMLNFVTYVCSHPSTFSDETVQVSCLF
ncbi:unnamed protein product [Trichobilharzia regenti]|nr:unnamed protein product [Trichobilharzia regenti]